MRLLIVFFFATFISCVDKKIEKKDSVENNTETSANITTDIDCGDFILKIDIDKEDFNIINKVDTVFIYKTLYGSIESKKIDIIAKKTKLYNISLNEDLEIQFYQRLTDDNKSFALDIFYNKLNKQKLLSNNFLSSNAENYKTILFNEHFLEIKKESLKKQTEFYKKLLENKSKYENCCPEYIQQSKIFLEKNDKSFTSFDSLNISPFINKNILTIRYDINKISRKKIIIFNEKSEEKKSNQVSSGAVIAKEEAIEVNSWEFSPSKTEKFKFRLYAPSISSQNRQDYFSYGYFVITGGEKTLETKKIVRVANKNSPYSAFEKIVFKNNFFTIEQYGDNNDYSTYEYITFKYENKSFYLHKYTIEYTSKTNPDENIPSKNWSKKDFGVIKLEDLGEKFFENLKSTDI
ncbi:hypothetical protein [Flavobacterium sp. FlaQc-47]|uniref:hypothetical protein n=1 Tax=Flavobacterium sp. FlaQc-47 TaxID=3374180 RepID=UPI003756EE77